MEENPRGEDLKLLIRLMRSLRDWGQADLAAAAGMDTSSICHYETTTTIPPRRTVQRLAAAVGLPLSFVEACLLPALEAARETVAQHPEPDFADLVRLRVRLEQTLTGIVRSALAAFLSKLEEWEPWERTGPPVEEDRLEARDAWKRLEPCTPEERRYLVETCCEFHTWALAERLCHESEEVASDRADRALELAGLAHRVAELVPNGEEWRWRLEGYALGFLANAQRVANDLAEAEETFASAWKLWTAGARAAPSLLAEWRLLDLEASLHRGRRRFIEALNRLDQARAVAPPEVAGRILLKKAATLDQMGDAEQSIGTLLEAAPLVDSQHEPRLLFGIRFNLTAGLCRLGRYAEAEPLLPEVRKRAAGLLKELDLVRVGWLEGKVNAGLGRTDEAVMAFEQARREFTTREMAYDAALVTLELAEQYLLAGRAPDVRTLAEEMVWVFHAQGIHREALAALHFFSEAARAEAATMEMARKVVRYLAQNDPDLRFEG